MTMQLTKQLLLFFIMLSIGLNAQNIGVKTVSPLTVLDVNGSVALREGTPLSIANGTNNNVAIDTMSFYRITAPTAVFTITGFANGTDGRLLILVNATTYTMTLNHQVTSSAANQINTGGSNLTFAANGVATLIYNATLSKWVLTGGQGITTGAASAWAITGNSGTVDGTNFLGTTDNIPLSIRVNNQKAGRIDHLIANTFWGYQAGNSVSTGNNNTALGHQALNATTNAWGNTASGYRALYANTTGQANVAIGDSALYTTSTISGLTAVGYQAGATTAANYGTFIGYQAGKANTTGTNHTMIGYQAGLVNTIGVSNTFIGYLAGTANIGGSTNVALGTWALTANTSGSSNVALGSGALGQTTIGSSNVAIGSQSGSSGTSSNYNVYVGFQAGANVTSGDANTFVGYNAGQGVATSNNNTLLGNNTNISSGLTNATAIGFSANATLSNTLILGGTAANAVKVGIGTTTPAQKIEVSDGNILLSNTSTAGELRFAEPSAGGSEYTSFKAQSQTANITYTLPAAAPTASGQILSSTTAGVLSWATEGQTTTNGITTPSAFTGTQNNYALLSTSATVYRISGSSTPIINGIIAGADGRQISIINIGATSIIINHQNASATTTNRFILKSAAAATLATDGIITFIYDATTARWREMTRNF